MTYDFIYNSLAAEAVSIGDPPPQGVADINTRGEKEPESDAKGAGGAIFTGFYSNRSKLSDGEKQSIFDKREQLNIKGGGNLKSFDNEK